MIVEYKFHKVANLDTSDVRVTALAMVNDLLLWHGLPSFITASNDEDNQSGESNVTDLALNNEQGVSSSLQTNLGWALQNNFFQSTHLTQNELNTQGGHSVVASLTKFLDDEDLEVRTKVAEGMCKLLMVGAVASAKLFQRLILMWYNPMAESDGKLRHVLGTFFPLYASMSRINQDSIEEAFLPTLKTLFDAPPNSPLGSIDIEDVGLFFTQLTREDFLQVRDSEATTNVHDTMAISLANCILSNPDAFYNKILLKLLTSLQISSSDFVKLRQIKELQEQMVEAISDKAHLRTLARYGAMLDELIAKDPGLKKNEDEQAEGKKEEAKEADNAEVEVTTAPVDESSLNGTKAAKKRTLFSQTQHTLMTSPNAEVAGKREADDDVFRSPRAPGAPAAKKKTPSRLSDVMNAPATPDEASKPKKSAPEKTIIAESSDDEEEEETLVSGNLSKRGKQALVGNKNSKEKTKEVPKVNVIQESSDEDIFAVQQSQGPVTSTQKDEDTTSSNSDNIIKGFYGTDAGKKARKLRKKGTTTEEESDEPAEAVETGSKRTKSTRKATSASNNKKAAPNTDSDDSNPRPTRVSKRTATSTSESTASPASTPSRRVSSRSSSEITTPSSSLEVPSSEGSAVRRSGRRGGATNSVENTPEQSKKAANKNLKAAKGGKEESHSAIKRKQPVVKLDKLTSPAVRASTRGKSQDITPKTTEKAKKVTKATKKTSGELEEEVTPGRATRSSQEMAKAAASRSSRSSSKKK